ncbi:MAG: hypothetical protein HQL67_07445 [Magnetococcales bacterium]|nr:hypothetical protein [Magnetococcales bacterium]
MLKNPRKNSPIHPFYSRDIDKTGLLSFFLVFALNFSLLQADERVRAYPPQQIAEHTYVIHGPLGYPSPENWMWNRSFFS